VVAAFMTLREYKLKLRAEVRLANAANIESDVKLLTLFTQLMEIAHARGPSMLVSDKLFEAMWPHLQKAGVSDPRSAALITTPVGAASQDAAIAAIAALGRKHKVLRPVALSALESLAGFKPQPAKKFFDELKREV